MPHTGQKRTLVPALAHLKQRAALPSRVAATRPGSGTISAEVNGVRYVLQPGIAVQLGESSGAV